MYKGMCLNKYSKMLNYTFLIDLRKQQENPIGTVLTPQSDTFCHSQVCFFQCNSRNQPGLRRQQPNMKMQMGKKTACIEKICQSKRGGCNLVKQILTLTLADVLADVFLAFFSLFSEETYERVQELKLTFTDEKINIYVH